MSADRTDSSDQPVADKYHDAPAVAATPQQVLEGLTVGSAQEAVVCTGCQQSRYEGQAVVVYACRREEAMMWEIQRWYCPACAPAGIETTTLGLSEVLTSARLGLRSFAAAQSHQLCLNEVGVEARSPPTEGNPP